jgi:hypothetical protein
MHVATRSSSKSHANWEFCQFQNPKGQRLLKVESPIHSCFFSAIMELQTPLDPPSVSANRPSGSIGPQMHIASPPLSTPPIIPIPSAAHARRPPFIPRSRGNVFHRYGRIQPPVGRQASLSLAQHAPLVHADPLESSAPSPSSPLPIPPTAALGPSSAAPPISST